MGYVYWLTGELGGEYCSAWSNIVCIAASCEFCTVVGGGGGVFWWMLIVAWNMVS